MVVQRVAVVGAGQMGRGIAQVCAARGLDVQLSDASQALAAQGVQRIEQDLRRQVEKGKLEPPALAQVMRHLHAVREPGEVDLAIEAASENRELKLSLLRALDERLPPGAMICSNTSSISITQLAAATGRPELVAGMHFMNPVPRMELVEVVRGLSTSQETLRVVLDLARALGKTTVVSEDRPGFIINRLLIPMLCEACLALEQGVASVEHIDTGMKLGLNHPMGPLRLSDLIGLDTVLAIAEVLHTDFGEDKYRPAPLLRNLVGAGWLGVKSGRGFYLYEGGRPAGVNPALLRQST